MDFFNIPVFLLASPLQQGFFSMSFSLLQGIEKVVVYLDNILITGSSVQARLWMLNKTRQSWSESNNNNTQFAAVAHVPSTMHPFSQAEQHTFIHIE